MHQTRQPRTGRKQVSTLATNKRIGTENTDVTFSAIDDTERLFFRIYIRLTPAVRVIGWIDNMKTHIETLEKLCFFLKHKYGHKWHKQYHANNIKHGAQC